MARSLHKTVDELLDGTPRPLSGPEWTAWVALNNIESAERQAAEKKLKSAGRARRGRRR